MAKFLVPDDLWAVIAPLLPPARVRPKAGRPPIPDRAALTGILFLLRTGLPWEYLPQEMGCSSGMSCWRRLRDWQRAGVRASLHRALLERLDSAGQLDWSRAALDSASLPAKKPGAETGPNPTDRGKPGTKRHLVVDARGTPLGVVLTGANPHNSTQLVATLDAIPPVRSDDRGRPRHRPGKLHADKAYDHRRCRRECRARGIRPRIARRGIESSQRLGRHRWVVERTLAWLARFRRLAIRYERRADIHLAFTTLACALVTSNQSRWFC
ncbi:IS5 family transposase [Methylobacterium sp. WL103]|uniref:IS5 family transposase n=1 Tax=Methylobacterium sp. WL103 TaxID=2603891 RepID=UPI0011C96622|nr:IS5 family transposase [Methylobacterium sp. WL103]TXN06761.1 IS5 family transposase [Methylobacterium sp. WL103]